MIACQKDAFRLDGVHYLNCAYMAPLSRSVEQAGIEGMQRKRIPTALRPNHFFDHTGEIRERFCRLIGAPAPESIAILPSASYGLAAVARNTTVRRGQNVVITGGQMPSNVYVWRRLCEEHGAALRVAPQPSAFADRGYRWNEAILGAIDGATAIVALGHVHWLDGTRFDLAAIAEKVHRGGGALIVDGTQSFGALPFDLRAVPADAAIAAGYKWLTGPYSIGAGYFGPRYADGTPLEENWLGRVNSQDFPSLINYQDAYRPGSIRYDVGEGSNFILAPMLAAALEQLLTWGVEEIERYCARLTGRIADAATELGFAVIPEDQRGPHYIGLGIPDHVDGPALQAALAAAQVVVSVRGPFVRITPNVYNNDEDVGALLEVLARFRPARSSRSA